MAKAIPESWLRTVRSAALAISRLGLIVAWSGALAITPFARGQEDEEEPFLPGLIGRYEPTTGDAFERLDRTIAFDGELVVPDRRLPRGPYRVTWRGRLLSQANGSYQLHVYSAGRVQVELQGRVVLDAATEKPTWQTSAPIELSYDYHPLLIRYENTQSSGTVQLFWSGPQFSLEPIDGRQLFHDLGSTPDLQFERGEQLVRALRCAGCHDIAGEPSSPPAPSLARLGETLDREWLVKWLTSSATPAEHPPGYLARRMPHFGLNATDAKDIADYLLTNSEKVPLEEAPSRERRTSTPDAVSTAKSKKKKGNDADEAPPKSPVERGRELFLSLGCLACHQLGELGETTLWDGGDLSRIAQKRPRDFFTRWLQSPQASNPQHRMPVFDLTQQDRELLATFLATLGGSHRDDGALKKNSAAAARGKELVARYRCAACHTLPGGQSTATTPKTRLHAESDWSQACSANRSTGPQPTFAVRDKDRAAIREFVSRVRESHRRVAPSGHQLLVEHNCLACHQRGEAPGLAAALTKLGEQQPELAPLIPAMTPPVLNSVGDKLHDDILRGAITRQGQPYRSYLAVRMPRFPLSDQELQALLAHFQTKDRIPAGAPAASPSSVSLNPTLLESVGTRLVTPDGFGCTSCHQIGKVLPAKAPLGARGPDLSMLGQRLRRSWFDRFVHNPARITPRMEMPSVQVAVRGVVPAALDQQLAAVWEILNKPGFQPPEPNPVRVLRHTGINPNDPPWVVTEVVRTSPATFIKPLLVGLANRHNFLFDLETARLVSWAIGDTTRQRTEGKTWFWEPAGKEIWRSDSDASELSLRRDGVNLPPRVVGQFVTEFDNLEHVGNGLRIRYRLYFGESNKPVHVSQTFVPFSEDGRSGFRRDIEVTGLADGDSLQLPPLPAALASPFGEGSRETAAAPSPPSFQITLRQPAAGITRGNELILESVRGVVAISLEYSTTLPVDRFPLEPPPPPPLQAEPLQVVPGFAATRLPLSDEIMPTALGWRPDGTLVIASLKGQVYQATDTDGDQLADQLSRLVDGLAAPYGLYVTADYVDVANKYAVLRLFDEDRNGVAERMVTLASGWGHTADYHDWAIGLPRDEQGNYFLALPCQQDQRSIPAANLRGHFLKLVPRQPTHDNPLQFAIETISRGHRFPMGIARRHDGELFVTDNQGNYNPFNELNHVRPGAHFGFINALEKKVAGDARPPLTPPAVNLPHPWVRSVNGICFLETPATARRQPGDDRFGPFEGHLVGCEMDTRRLIRMSLQRVGDTFQGAAYPLSYDQPVSGDPLLGPLAGGISPDGDLYIGGLRDSGWGGANNIGEVVRLQLIPERLPCGIAEMRAVRDGFVVRFTSAVDPELARNPSSYALASYTRESTPAYGGSDVDRRTERIRAVTLSDDGQQVELKLDELRTGYVYELHVKNLAPVPQPSFFPAEAHFTLLRVPEN